MIRGLHYKGWICGYDVRGVGRRGSRIRQKIEWSIRVALKAGVRGLRRGRRR